MFLSLALLFVVTIVFNYNQIRVQGNVDCVLGEIDLVFVIDASNSIGFGKFRKLKTFLKDFLDHSSIDDGAVRVGVVTFSTSVEVEFLLNEYTTSAEVIDRIGKIKYTAGATNTAGGLNMTREVLLRPENGDREDVINFICVISDGKSNLNKPYTIPFANLLKQDGACVYGLAIGKELSDHPEEMYSIVSEPAADNIQMIADYNDLVDMESMIFSKICPVIEEKTVIKVGSACSPEGKIVEKRCRTFKCVNNVWTKLGFTGCISGGRCFQWKQEKEQDCNTHKCFKSGSCDGDLCSAHDFRLINSGCLVDGKCIDENKVVEDKDTCALYKCVRKEDLNEAYGNYVMVSKECVGPDGLCRATGYTYEEHCIQFECQLSQYMGITQAEFMPVDVACKHGSDCIPFGETVKEVCDVLICNYDDKSMGYVLMLQSQGCEYNGGCLKKNEKVFEESTCTNFICSYSRREKRLVIKERVAGCKGDDGGCAGKGDVITEKGCIKYECDTQGNFQLLEAGCEVDGQCKEVGSTWRFADGCAEFTCIMGQTYEGSVETQIQKTVECHDFNGNCVAPGNTFEDHCKMYRCKNNGKLEVLTAGCDYDGECYAIGEDWVDRKLCKHVVCKSDPLLGAVYRRKKFGCKDDEGRCWAPGEICVKPGSCQKYKCYDDHVLRRESCEYKDKCYDEGQEWVDPDDCLMFSCFKDDYTGEAEVSTTPYGCFEEGVCKSPGDSYAKDCQTYECMPNGEGFKIVASQCPWRQGCKNLNQTWFDKKTCRSYGCFEDEEGIDIEEVTYGCRHEDDTCLKHGEDAFEDECMSYECDNGILVPTNVRCESDYGCLDLNELRVDEEKCIKYKCVMSKSGDDFVATKIKEIRGCLDHDKCFFPGARKTEDCSTYVCTRDGTFKLTEAKCEFAGDCYDIDALWENQEKCKKFKCVLSAKTGRPVVKSWVYGCKANNRCFKFGAKRRLRKCMVYKCERTDGGPRFQPFKIGCVKGRRCKPVDSTWIDKDVCARESCTFEEGNMYPEIIPTPYGCFDQHGDCHAFGHMVDDDDNHCVKYECTGYGTFAPVQTGCFSHGKCRKDGAMWKLKGDCTKYRCERENIGAYKVIMHTIEIPGCMGLDGNCLKGGDTIRFECTDYLCDTSRGGLVITGEGCINSGECHPLNTTWLNPSTCITYQCQYDTILKDLFIVEKQIGCQEEGGECFNKGEKRPDGCSKFLCNANGNFQVIKAGCEMNGKCYNNDESWQDGCVWYTCLLMDKGPNFVETKVVETHGCVGVDGNCYEPHQVFNDGCIQFVCEIGGTFKEENFGCVGFNGDCVLPGSTVEHDCNQYQCDPYALGLQPVSMACNFSGGCMQIDEKWFDKETCLGYKCVYDPATNDVDIIERVSGCQTEEKCIRPGIRSSGKDCIEYTCKQGEMVATEIGCEYNGECLALYEVVQEGCSWKKCLIAQEGPTFIDTKLVTEHGCYDCFHGCHRVGGEYAHGCKVMECLPGGFVKTIENRCMTPSGYCIGYGETYEYNIGLETETYVCGELGNLEATDEAEEHKCKESPYGKEFDIDAEITVNCIRYKCVKTLDSAQFIEQERECMYENECYSAGATWSNETECHFYSCSLDKGVPKISSNLGCSGDVCHADGEEWLKDCFKYRCDVTTKQNTLVAQTVIVEGYCQDLNGICIPPNDPETPPFDVMMGGSHYYGCTCTYADYQVNYACEGVVDK